ncbi:hypothetical protein Tco_1371822 [Tanacetum coccineum]
MRILRLREVARMTARIALEFAPEFVYVYCMDFVECYLILLGLVEEKMTLKDVDGQTVEEIETKIISKDGTITRVPGKFQGYKTSKEEPLEQPRRHDLYGFLDHP